MMIGFALLLVAVAIGSTQGLTCHGDSDCGLHECCYVKPEFEVVSKRQIQTEHVIPTLVLPTMFLKVGVCESFKVQGEHCNWLEVQNGHCGCLPGLSCTTVPEPTPTSSTPVPTGFEWGRPTVCI